MRQGGGGRGAGSGISVLTLHPVSAHWAEEVGVEAEGLVNLPEDLPDVPDLPRYKRQTPLHFLEGASDFQPMRTETACLDPQRKPLRGGRRESFVTNSRPRPGGGKTGHGRRRPLWGLAAASARTTLPGALLGPHAPLTSPLPHCASLWGMGLF